MSIFPNIGLRRKAGSSDHENLTGAGWIILSCIGATIMSVTVRLLGDSIPTVQVAFLRSALGIWVLLPVLLHAKWRHESVPIRFSRPWLHGIRGTLFAIATTCGFYALTHLPLATATTLFFLSPVFATAFAAVFAGESVGPRRWAAVAAAFIGALIILRPGIIPLNTAMMAAVLSATCFALALLITRPLSDADGASSIMLSSSVVASAVLCIPALMLWVPVPGAAWGLLALLVLASSLRMIADVRAYSLADAGYLAPFAFLRLLFIAAAGWLVFREGIDASTLAGATVIVGASIFIAWREARLRHG